MRLRHVSWRQFPSILVIGSSLALPDCATAMVTSAVVGTAMNVTVAVKVTVGVAKLAYRSTKTAVKGTGRLLSGSEPKVQ